MNPVLDPTDPAYDPLLDPSSPDYMPELDPTNTLYDPALAASYGYIVDPASDPALAGMVYDDYLGLYYDASTDAYYDPFIGDYVDPLTGLPDDGSLILFDWTTGDDEFVWGNTVGNFSGGDGSDSVDLTTMLAAAIINLLQGTFQTTIDGADKKLLMSSIEHIVGSIFGDLMTGDANANDFAGGAGADNISGGGGDDKVDGGADGDNLKGESGNDTISGGAGNDTLDGGIGNDNLDGGIGADNIKAGDGSDIVNGGAGADTINGEAGSDTINAGDGSDIVDGGLGDDIEHGNAGDDTENGGSGNDKLFGDAGNDTLDGGVGNDAMNGGDGNDTYYIDSALDTVIEASGTAAAGTDKIIATISLTLGNFIENLTLSGADAINGTGNALANVMNGNGAANRLTGGGGGDTINGGAGSDTLSGGAGKDNFLFNTALNGNTNRDTITDFSSADDTIKLDNAIFKAFGVTGQLAAAKFYASASGSAHDADDRILYNTKTGVLSYDADGNHAGAAIVFAVITGHPTINASDFVVV